MGPVIPLRNQLVAQAFQPVQRRLKPAATNNCLLIATQYNGHSKWTHPVYCNTDRTSHPQAGASGPRASGASRQQLVEKLQKKAELIEQWLTENQPKQGAAGRENQSNITDNESAKMMTSHGAVQGYNSQALIDAKHQVIVHGEAFGHGQDHGHVPPMLAGALTNLQGLGHGPDYFQGKILTADSNYHAQVNLKECQELGLDA